MQRAARPLSSFTSGGRAADLDECTYHFYTSGMGKISGGIRHPIYWLYAFVIAMLCGHVLCTRVGASGVDFYNFWIAAQIPKDLGTIEIYDPKLQSEFGQFYFKKYYTGPPLESQKWIGAYLPTEQQSLEESRREFAESPRRFFNFVDPLAEFDVFQTAVATRRLFPDLAATPFLVAATSFSTTGHFSVDYLAFRILSLFCFVVAIFLCCMVLQINAFSATVLCGTFLVFFFPVRYDSSVGNVTEIQFGLLGFCIWSYARQTKWGWGFAGFFLMLSLLLKPLTLAVFPLLFFYWIRRKSWRTAGAFLGGNMMGLFFALLSTVLFFGTLEPWTKWYTLILSKVGRRWDFLSEMTNFSILQFVYEVTGLQIFSPALLLAILLIALLWVFKRMDRSVASTSHLIEDSRNVFWLIAMGCAAMLICAKLVWQYYQILYIPLLLILFQDFSQARSKGSIDHFRLLLLFVIFIVLGQDGLDWRMRALTAMTQAGANVAASLLLCILGFAQYRRRFGQTLS